MSINNIVQDWQKKRLQEFRPYTMQKRALIIDAVVTEIRKKGLRSLNENDKDDLKKIEKIVFELFPLTHPRTARDYARVAIILWKKK